jgi:hypothetical protein
MDKANVSKEDGFVIVLLILKSNVHQITNVLKKLKLKIFAQQYYQLNAILKEISHIYVKMVHVENQNHHVLVNLDVLLDIDFVRIKPVNY